MKWPLIDYKREDRGFIFGMFSQQEFPVLRRFAPRGVPGHIIKARAYACAVAAPAQARTLAA